jgi:hypothetical protein
MQDNMTSRRTTNNKDTDNKDNNEWTPWATLPQVERGVAIRDVVRGTYGWKSD